MKTLNEGEAFNKIKKGLKGAAIGAGVLGATAAGVTGYGAVNGIRQARAEKAALERQAEEEKAAKDQYANELAQKLHKKGVEVKEKGTEIKDAVYSKARKTKEAEKTVEEELMEEANLIVEASEDFSRFEKKVKKIEKRLQNESLCGHYTQEEIEVFKKKIASVKKLLNASNKNEDWEDSMTDAADDFNRAVKKASGGRVISFLFLPLGWIPPIGRAYSKAIRKVTGTTLKEETNYFPY